MPEPIGPAIARDRLRRSLSGHRTTAGRSILDVERALSWPVGKLSEIESGTGVILPLDVDLLLDHYGVADRVELLALAGVARPPMWWSRHGMTGEFQQFVAYEAEADAISVYQPIIVHGLLQTRPYALAVTAAILGRPESDPDVIARADVRMERQHFLTGRVPSPRLTVILDEVVLQRPVGGPGVLRGQLEHLRSRASEPHVTIVVMPTRGGVHVGCGGVFELLEYDHDPGLVFIEGAFADQSIRSRQVVARYGEIVRQLRETDPGGERTRAALDEAIDSLPSSS